MKTQKVEHICTIKDSYNYKTKHLVYIDNNLYTFIFNYHDILDRIDKGDEYFFTNCKLACNIVNKLKNKNDILGIYDHYIDSKLPDNMYVNLFLLEDKVKWFVNELNSLKENINKLIK